MGDGLGIKRVLQTTKRTLEVHFIPNVGKTFDDTFNKCNLYHPFYNELPLFIFVFTNLFLSSRNQTSDIRTI